MAAFVRAVRGKCAVEVLAPDNDLAFVDIGDGIDCRSDGFKVVLGHWITRHGTGGKSIDPSRGIRYLEGDGQTGGLMRIYKCG